MWAEDERILNAIFGFHHSIFSEAQDSSTCIKLSQILDKFLATKSHAWRLEKSDIIWFPDYGCAALGTPFRGQFRDHSSNLSLIGLDGWKFSVHASNRGRDYVAAPTSSVIVHLGTVLTTNKPQVMSDFASKLLTAQQRHGQQRSAAVNAQGHQKTPAFIKAVFEDALSGGYISSQPRGGFTDVGQHTGGPPRATSWKLVESVLEHSMMLNCSSSLSPSHNFLSLLSEFYLWLLDRQLTLLNSCNINSTFVNAVMVMLQHVTKCLATLADDGFDVNSFERVCEDVRSRLIEMVGLHHHAHASRFVLPSTLSPRNFFPGENMMIGSLPEPVRAQGNAHSVVASKELARTNLQMLPVLKPKPWESLVSGSCTYECYHLVLHKYECYFFVLASTLSQPTAKAYNVAVITEILDSYRIEHHAFVATKFAMHTAMVEELKSKALLCTWIVYCTAFKSAAAKHPLVQSYAVALRWQDLQHLVLSERSAINALSQVADFLKARSGKRGELFSLRGVEEQTTFEFAQEFAANDVDMMEQLSRQTREADDRKAKRWQVILGKKKEAIRLKAVVAALELDIITIQRQLTTELAKKNSTEHMLNEANTALRQAMSAVSSARSDRWKAERGSSWERTLERTYDRKVAEKTELETRGRELSSQYNAETIQWHTTTSAVNDKQRLLRNACAELKEVEKTPLPICQPLPRDDERSRKIIFFLAMPKKLRLLARLSFVAQQMLVPYAAPLFDTFPDVPDRKSFFKLFDVQPFAQDWTTYFDTYSSVKAETGSSTRFFDLVSDVRPPVPSALDPRHIDNCRSMEDGVWYPDSMTPAMGWKGGNFSLDMRGGYINPFVIDGHHRIKALNFTPILSDPALCMYTEQCGFDHTARDRSNRAIANQASKPTSWTKPQYLTFAALRAYPYQQFRKLCIALEDDLLPWQSEDVSVIARALLFHVGELSSESPSRMLWKDELFPDGLPKLERAVRTRLEEIREKPRDHKSLLLLAELATFGAQWSPSSRSLARDIAKVALGWMDDLTKRETNLLSAPLSSDILNELQLTRSKRALLCLYAIICHERGALDGDDVRDMCRLTVVSFNSRVLEGSTPLDEDIAALAVRAHHVMMERMERVRPLVTSDMLTAACLQVMASTPQDLHWMPCLCDDDEYTGCYEAISTDQHLYSINLCKGFVLIDGKFMTRLPGSILQNPLYTRTFGDRNFEIFITGDGSMQTARPINGCLYTFQQSGTRLVITEIDAASPCDQLELMDAAWANDLPKMLRDLYSCWYCRKSCCILLRDFAFLARDVHFIIQKDVQTLGNPERCACIPVPAHIRQKKWSELVKVIRMSLKVYNGVQMSTITLPNKFAFPMDRLVSNVSGVSSVLSKFDDVNFVHTLACASGAVRFCLPRFGLEFELDAAGTIRSLDFAGYVLSPHQQLDDTLLNVSRYIVLVQDAECKILISDGLIRSHPDQDNVDIVTPSNSSDLLQFHTYDVHRRFKHLMANSISSRLFLAALYAASSTMLPEPRLGMSGVEIAIELLRQCFLNRPMSPIRCKCLNELKSFTSLSPSLLLLCQQLEHVSEQLKPLFCPCSSNQSSPVNASLRLALDSDAVTEYQCLVRDAKMRTRLLLSDEEEMVMFGARVSESAHGSLRHHRTLAAYRTVDVARDADIDVDIVEGIERELFSMVEIDSQSSVRNIDELLRSSTKLGEHLVSSLAVSHDVYCKLPKKRLHCTNSISQRITALRPWLKAYREKVEKYLHDAVNAFPPELCGHMQAFRLMKLCGRKPTLTNIDIARAVCRHEIWSEFNPFLSTGSCQHLRACSLLWLKLCVLEDKFIRIEKFLGSNQDAQVMEELECRREWDANEHPDWLVFEAEGALQIRPRQFKVAMHLVSNPNSIVQMNMGEGKTRVIIPMVLLHFLRLLEREQVLRLHFLTQLLADAFDHLHNVLTASVLRVKFYLLPFNREVEVTNVDVNAVLFQLQSCQQYRGVVLVAPEHRLSLLLKMQEARLVAPMNAELASAINQIFDVTYVDGLDESDELARHTYQLIYAVGNKLALPDGASRWTAAESLLVLLRYNPDIQSLLTSLPELCMSGIGRCTPQELGNIRILPGDVLTELKASLLRMIAIAFLHDPPYEFLWLANHPDHKEILDFITLPQILHEGARAVIESRRAQGTLEPVALFDCTVYTSKEIGDILALRGLLACGVLLHCLQKRHRNDFGIKRVNAKKQMAVPFRASDTPSERSEYGHPDCALMFTILSYCSDGLSRVAFDEAVRRLLSLGPSAQEQIYMEWFRLSESAITEQDRSRLDAVSKIDITNSSQMDLMYAAFRRNMKTVFFWLNTIVFPTETMQFPNKLVANAWNLTSGGNVIGFSGTDDNQLILPLHVRQEVIDDDYLISTNGKMLHLLLEAEYFPLDDPTREINAAHPPPTICQRVLKLCALRNVNALIDAGGLMAGVSNRSVATMLLNEIDCSVHKGVVFFDVDIQMWQVCDRSGREWPKFRSPIQERDAFVYFDESRCRGADMKLKTKAVAVLTVGARMCKDKLVQGAGRMRQLGKGQTIVLTGSPDVTQKICATMSRSVIVEQHAASPACTSTGLDLQMVTGTTRDRTGPTRENVGTGRVVGEGSTLTSSNVLQWVICNTIEATQDGLYPWAMQGKHFTTTSADPDAALLEETCSVQELYLQALIPQEMASAFSKHVGKQRRSSSAPSLSDAAPLNWEVIEAKIHDHVSTFGKDFNVVAANLDEECERELEKEVEEEEEYELEVARVIPVAEADWDYNQVTKASTVAALPKDAAIVPLSHFIMTHIANSVDESVRAIQSIQWGDQSIFVTRNFLRTIEMRGAANLGEYLRPVDAILYFPTNKSCLLLSEREADRVLVVLADPRKSQGLLWRGANLPQLHTPPILLNICSMRLAHLHSEAPRQQKQTLLFPFVGQMHSVLGAEHKNMELLTRLQLFNGETAFPSPHQRSALRQSVIPMPQMKAAALQLPGLRGLKSMVPRSDLDILCSKKDG